MGEIKYIIIAKQCEVARKLLILNGCLKKSFSSVYDLGKRFFGHPSCIDDFPCNLTQFCYIPVDGMVPKRGVCHFYINVLCEKYGYFVNCIVETSRSTNEYFEADTAEYLLLILEVLMFNQ